MRGIVLATGLLPTIFLATTPGALHAQMAGRPFQSWTGKHPDGGPPGASASQRLSGRVGTRGSARSPAGEGLLIGGVVGAVVTTVFLLNFCAGSDTSCGADEVGRAVMVIAVPCAAIGALLGSTGKTEE